MLCCKVLAHIKCVGTIFRMGFVLCLVSTETDAMETYIDGLAWMSIPTILDGRELLMGFFAGDRKPLYICIGGMSLETIPIPAPGSY